MNKTNNKVNSVENSCMSSDGRSFHSYLYDATLDRHVIVSEFAPFFGDDVSSTATNNSNDGNNLSYLKITTVLPATISESITIDSVIGLICVDGNDNNDGGSKSAQSKRRHQQQQQQQGENGTPMTSTLPWMCLYTATSAFLLSIGYDENTDNYDHHQQHQQQVVINGKILQTLEPFEKQLLTSPRGSSILRIRPAPNTNSMFCRCGSMAMLLREGGEDEYDNDGTAGVVGYVLVLYHGLPESILAAGVGGVGVGGRMTSAAGGRSKGRDFGARNSTSEGAVTTPLRFEYQDLVRGMQDTMEAENEAFSSSSLRDRDPSSSPMPSQGERSMVAKKRVTDYCFMNPSSGAASGSACFTATSIFIVCNDGSVYGASPIIFDGTILPRSAVVHAISHLEEEIEASTSFMQMTSSSSPVPSMEQEEMEARTRQCRAARRYLLDAFGIPEGVIGGNGNNARPMMQGSYYVSASVVHSRHTTTTRMDNKDGRFSQALAWQPRLQGPLIMPPDSTNDDSSLPPCVCIESFGSAAGAGIIDGFVIVRHDNNGHCQESNNSNSSSSPIHVEFGILPGEGAVILPRFEFESDVDCQLMDEFVRGTGMYVERASIMNDKRSTSGDNTPSSRALTVTPAASSAIGRTCSIVVDPLDDIMVHVMTSSRIVTLTTNAIAVMANCFKSRVAGNGGGGSSSLSSSSIRTKVWSGLEVNSSAGDAALIGARVSGDVHLGHILLARVSNGSMEVVNITATQCLHETSEQMNAKSEQLDASDASKDDEALQVLKRVQPLPELLQPLVDKVSNGLSKMGKIVGGATLPKDAGPENLAIFLETQHSCEVNVLMPMEEMSKILSARRELLREMYNHQAAELGRLTALLDEFKVRYESNLKRVVELESNASVLAERSSAVLTATRELRPQITNAEAAYFKDLQRYETSCNKWEGTVDQIQQDATTSCDAMSSGAIENGDVRCLVDLPPKKIEVSHKLLRGEKLLLQQLEKRVKESSAVVEKLSKTISGLDSVDAARLRLLGGDKENQRR